MNTVIHGQLTPAHSQLGPYIIISKAEFSVVIISLIYNFAFVWRKITPESPVCHKLEV